jgi:hypothetical protein
MFRTSKLSQDLTESKKVFQWTGNGIYGSWMILVVATKLSDVKRVVRKHYDPSSSKEDIIFHACGNFGENPISEKDIIKIIRNTGPFRITSLDKITLTAAVC